MSDKWTDKLRDRLSDYEAPAPDGLWEDILTQVQTQAPTPVWKSVLKYVAYPAAAVIAGVGYLLFMEPKEVLQSDEKVVAEWKEPQQTSKPEQIITPQETIASAEPTVTSIPKTTKESSSSNEEAPINFEIFLEDEPTIVPADEDDKVVQPGENPDKNTVSAVEDDFDVSAIVIPERRRTPSTTTWLDVPQANKVEMGFYASNMVGQSGMTLEGFGDHYPSSVQALASSAASTASGRSFHLGSEIRTLNRVQDTKLITENSIPIKLGFSVSYYVTPHFALESGLNLTILSTKVTMGTMQYRTQTNFDSYLIGIPLGVKYDIWRFNHFTLYANGGMTMETRIHRKATTQYTLDATVVEDPFVDKETGGSKLLWSLRGGAGISYKFGPHVGIYFEPGVIYYLDKQTLIDATQLSKPMIPSFTFGVNMSF